jgi:hypothetical protein
MPRLGHGQKLKQIQYYLTYADLRMSIPTHCCHKQASLAGAEDYDKQVLFSTIQLQLVSSMNRRIPGRNLAFDLIESFQLLSQLIELERL